MVEYFPLTSEPRQLNMVALTPSPLPPRTPVESQRKAAQLVNGQYPGPAIEVYENDTVEVVVINDLISDGVTIHWHGVHPIDDPWVGECNLA